MAKTKFNRSKWDKEWRKKNNKRYLDIAAKHRMKKKLQKQLEKQQG